MTWDARSLANSVGSAGGENFLAMANFRTLRNPKQPPFFAMCVGTRDSLPSHNSRMAKASKWFARQWRKHRGLTLELAAERIKTAGRVKMTAGYLSDLEKGERRWNQDHVEALADVYNCEPADLLMRDPADTRGIWTIWDQIPATQRETAARVLEGFVKKTG